MNRCDGRENSVKYMQTTDRKKEKQHLDTALFLCWPAMASQHLPKPSSGEIDFVCARLTHSKFRENKKPKAPFIAWLVFFLFFSNSIYKLPIGIISLEKASEQSMAFAGVNECQKTALLKLVTTLQSCVSSSQPSSHFWFPICALSLLPCVITERRDTTVAALSFLFTLNVVCETHRSPPPPSPPSPTTTINPISIILEALLQQLAPLSPSKPQQFRKTVALLPLRCQIFLHFYCHTDGRALWHVSAGEKNLYFLSGLLYRKPHKNEGKE